MEDHPQADICHAYHVMLAEGISAKRIIVMMYDDIAFNKNNPTPGVLINRPNGKNVYAGVKIDYKREDVNPKNFLRVLQGDKKAMTGIGTGRVVESNNRTNLFINFVGHGNAGLLAFPSSSLDARTLINTLNRMYAKKKYNKIIMYIEACYAGSIFDHMVSENSNVFVLTASARDESSYATYCRHGLCLGDEFSVSWMDHMDSESKGTFETFFHQFNVIRTAVAKSHVQIYGDYHIGSAALTPNSQKGMKRTSPLKEAEGYSSMDAKDVSLYHLKHKATKSFDIETRLQAAKELAQIVEGRKSVDQLMDTLVEVATADDPLQYWTVKENRLNLAEEMFPCYKNLIDHFTTHCSGLEHEYVIYQFHKLANICILHLNTTKLLNEMPTICASYEPNVATTDVFLKRGPVIKFTRINFHIEDILQPHNKRWIESKEDED